MTEPVPDPKIGDVFINNKGESGMARVEGKAAQITGGASGLGRGDAILLAR